MIEADQLRQWLFLVYRIPAEPSRMRTYAWRQVKALGALYLQQAGWLLPKTERFERALQDLVAKIEEFGGEASLFGTISPGAAWEEKVMRSFNQARDEEYAEIVENEERFEDEIHRETRKEKFTFAELEEAEAEWERLKRWYDRVRERDFFDDPGRQEADARLEAGESLLDEFTRRVYERQGVGETSGERNEHN